VAAGTAGVEMSTVANASVKLTKNLTGVDDESKAAGAALAALGLNLKDFKALAPEEQMDTLAKALAGFEDGASKTAVAVALLGKSGAELLPFLKELAAEGGRQVILTAEQIRLADEYSDAQARARTELNLYAQVAATQALPAITALTGVAIDLIKEIIGVNTAGKDLANSDAIAEFANNSARAFAFIADAADSVGRIFRVTGNVIGATAAQIGALADGDLKRYNAIQADASQVIDGIIARQTIRFSLEKRIADQAANAAARAQEDRGFKPGGKVLQFAGAAAGGKVAKEAKEAAESYKELERWVRESGRAFEELVRAEQQALDVQHRATNSALDRAKVAQDNNEKLRDEIAITLGGEEAQKALAKAYAESAIAEEEKLLVMRASKGASKEELEAINLTIDALREYRELLDGKEVAAKLKKDAAELQDVKNMFADMFADTFTDIITGTKSVEDAFKDLAASILQQISRIAAQQVANQIFGGTNGQSGFFDVMMKLIGAGIGGASGGGGGGGFAIDELASGGVARGGLTLVGEQGPELVSLPKGANVSNANDTRGMMGGVNVVNHFSVQGPVNRATENQIAQAAARGIARAGRR
jgi:hypothetical protein